MRCGRNVDDVGVRGRDDDGGTDVVDGEGRRANNGDSTADVVDRKRRSTRHSDSRRCIRNRDAQRKVAAVNKVLASAACVVELADVEGAVRACAKHAQRREGRIHDGNGRAGQIAVARNEGCDVDRGRDVVDDDRCGGAVDLDNACDIDGCGDGLNRADVGRARCQNDACGCGDLFDLDRERRRRSAGLYASGVADVDVHRAKARHAQCARVRGREREAGARVGEDCADGGECGRASRKAGVIDLRDARRSPGNNVHAQRGIGAVNDGFAVAAGVKPASDGDVDRCGNVVDKADVAGARRDGNRVRAAATSRYHVHAQGRIRGVHQIDGLPRASKEIRDNDCRSTRNCYWRLCRHRDINGAANVVEGTEVCCTCRKDE
jgi:hypothetical protein